MGSSPQTNLCVAERVATLLEERGLPFVVIGAVALAAHGYIRQTDDIDLGANADLEQMRGLVEALLVEGYKAKFNEPDADDPLAGVIDIEGSFGLVQVISFEDRFPAVIRDALLGEEIRVSPGSKLRIAPIPQLVALKLYAGGLASAADILELLRRNPEADLELIRKTCRNYALRDLDRILEELNEEN